MRIRVLLVDNEDVWIQTITEHIKKYSRIKLVGCVKSEKTAVDFLEQNAVDIVLLDLDLESEGESNQGVKIAKAIKQVAAAKIFIITSKPDIQRKVIRVGIAGYLMKDQIDLVGRAVEDIYDHCYPYETILNDYNRYRLMAELAVLTNAEKTILRFLLEETSISSISIQCHTSENTVKKQINSIYRKLNIQSGEKNSRRQLMERYAEALVFL